MTGYRMKGFGRVVWVSALLHAGVAAVAALLFNSEPKRVFINPVQMVDLVAEPKPKREKAAPQQPKQAAPEKAPAPVETPPAPEVEKPPPAPPPKEAQKPEAAPKESTAQSVKIKEKEAPKPPSIDDTLRSISESVRKREDKETVSSKVEEIKKKLEEEEARRERLSKLRAEISSREPAKATPEARAGAAPAQKQERPSGGSVKAFEDKYPAYYTIIKTRIDDNWTYPQSLKEGRVSLIVSIKIARSGELMNASVEVSSGNPVFDESLVSAVWRAAPFPPLPADFEGDFLETGLRFCPGCAQR